MASAALYKRVVAQQEREDAERQNCRAPQARGTGEERGGILFECGHLSAFFDTHRFVLSPSNFRAILEGVDMLRALGPLGAGTGVECHGIQDRNRDANEHQQNAKGCVASSSCMSHASPRFRAMKYTKLPTKIRPTIKM